MNRKGFAVFLMFLVIMLVLFAGFFARSLEILSVGRIQKSYLHKNASIIQVPIPESIPRDSIIPGTNRQE